MNLCEENPEAFLIRNVAWHDQKARHWIRHPSRATLRDAEVWEPALRPHAFELALARTQGSKVARTQIRAPTNHSITERFHPGAGLSKRSPVTLHCGSRVPGAGRARQRANGSGPGCLKCEVCTGILENEAENALGIPQPPNGHRQ